MANSEQLFQKYRAGYDANWAGLTIRPSCMADIDKQARTLISSKERYRQVERLTGVPWWFTGLCHYREASFRFDRYLGNGQPLNRVTTIVPEGRGPFGTFEDGAVDAFKIKGWVGAKDWSLARVTFRLEGFNGYGYHGKGVNSPYLYGGSNRYGPPDARAGKYVRDHVFDPNHVDTQLGTLVILKRLAEIDPDVSLPSTGLPAVIPGQVSSDATVLTMGSVGEAVRAVQTRLDGLNYKLGDIDGEYGPLTRAAVLAFQSDNHLPITGEVDAATRAALPTAKPRPMSDERKHATVEDLRRLGSKTVELADWLKKLSIATGAVGGIGVLDANTNVVTRFLTGLQGMVTPTAGIVPTPTLPISAEALGPVLGVAKIVLGASTGGTSAIVLALAPLLWRAGQQIIARRLKDHQTGANLGH
jgi:lysozyme family protein